MTSAFLSAAQVERLNSLTLRAFRTRYLLGPRVSITLFRDVEMDGTATAQTAAEALITFVERGGQVSASAASATRLRAGTLEREAPWDVRPGDRFGLPDGTWGRVTLVPLATGGVQSAEFELELSA
jgi:hypothetical protein